MGFRILAVGRDHKTVKGEEYGALTGIQFLAPAMLSGVNLCAWSTAACRALCLFEAGRGSMHVVRDGRLRMRHLMLHEWDRYIGLLEDDYHRLEARADLLGLDVGVGHGGRMLCERLCPTKTDRQLDQAEGIQKAEGLGFPTDDVE